MGKKTIKVKFTDTIERSSMFCQSKKHLLEIYSESALEGMVGCVIRPLEHSNGKYFFYRKKLSDDEMLVCGECYPCSTEIEYQQGVYYLDEDHEPNSCFFVEEDSLTDDDAHFDEEKYNEEISSKKKDQKLQQEVQKLVDSNPITNNEIRVYIVNVQRSNIVGRSTSDEEFISEAENQGTVYSLKGFEDAFNLDDIASDNCLIRII